MCWDGFLYGWEMKMFLKCVLFVFLRVFVYIVKVKRYFFSIKMVVVCVKILIISV